MDDSDDDYDQTAAKNALAATLAESRRQQDEALRKLVKAEEERVASLRKAKAGKQALKDYTKQLMARFVAHMSQGDAPGTNERDKHYLPDDEHQLNQKSIYQLKLEEFEDSSARLEEEHKVETDRLNEEIGEKEREVAEVRATADEHEKKVASQQAEIVELEQQSKLLKKEVEVAQGELTACEAREETVRRQLAEVAEKNEGLIKDSVKAKHLEEENKLKSAKMSENASTREEMQELIEALRADKAEALEEARKAQRNEQAAKDDVQHLQERYEKLKGDHEAMEETAARSRAQGVEAETLVTKAAAAEDDVAQLQKRVTERDADLLVQRQQVASLQTQLLEVERTAKSRSEQLKDAREDVQRLEDDKARMRDRSRGAGGGWDEGESTLNNTLTTSRLGTECLKIAQMQMSIANDELNEHIAHLAEKDAELERVHAELDAEHAAKERLRLDVERERIEVQRVTEDMALLRESMNEKIADKQREIEELNGKVAERAALPAPQGSLSPAPQANLSVMSEAARLRSYTLMLDGWDAREYKAPRADGPDTQVFPANVLLTEASRRLGIAPRHVWLCIGRRALQIMCREDYSVLMKWGLTEIGSFHDEGGQVFVIKCPRAAGHKAGTFRFKTPFSSSAFDHLDRFHKPLPAPAPAPALHGGYGAPEPMYNSAFVPSDPYSSQELGYDDYAHASYGNY